MIRDMKKFSYEERLKKFETVGFREEKNKRRQEKSVQNNDTKKVDRELLFALS